MWVSSFEAADWSKSWPWMIVFEDVVSRLSSFNIIMRCSPRASHQCLGVTRILPWQPGLCGHTALVSGQYHPMPDVSVRPRGHNEGQHHNRSDDCRVAPVLVTIMCLPHSLRCHQCLNVTSWGLTSSHEVTMHCPHDHMSPGVWVHGVKHGSLRLLFVCKG